MTLWLGSLIIVICLDSKVKAEYVGILALGYVLLITCMGGGGGLIFFWYFFLGGFCSSIVGLCSD